MIISALLHSLELEVEVKVAGPQKKYRQSKEDETGRVLGLNECQKATLRVLYHCHTGRHNQSNSHSWFPLDIANKQDCGFCFDYLSL